MKKLISLLVVVVCMMTTTTLFGQKKPSTSWQTLGENDSLVIQSLNVNSAKDDYSPIYIDGMLYFSSSRKNRNTDEADLQFNENIYTTHFIDSVWSPPKKFYFFNSDDYTALAGFSSEGPKLFTYKTFGNGDLYCSTRGKKHWSTPRQMKPPVNSDSHEQSVAEANGIMVISSERPGGRGEHDLYWSRKNDAGQYIIFVPLDMINTSGDEVDVCFGSDKKTLYFSSNGSGGKGGYDIFSSTLDKDGQWLKPQALPINSAVDDRWFMNCDSMFFLSSSRPGGAGGDDIYWGHIVPKLHPRDTTKLAHIKPHILPKDSVIVPIVFLGNKDKYDSLRNVKLIAIDSALKNHKFDVYYAEVQIGAYYYLQSINEFKFNYPAFDTTKILVEEIQTQKGILYKYLIDKKYTTLKESAIRQQQAVYQQTDQANRYKIIQGDAFIAVYDKAGQRILIYFNVYTGACRILIGDKTIYF